ncbi:hypothetical protein BHE74_00031395 [Ensete ventricosum]|nr:hypothetical protein BHE74_00031395 [Ensete ventricosum]
MSNCHRSRSLGSIPFSSVEDKSVMSTNRHRRSARDKGGEASSSLARMQSTRLGSTRAHKNISVDRKDVEKLRRDWLDPLENVPRAPKDLAQRFRWGGEPDVTHPTTKSMSQSRRDVDSEYGDYEFFSLFYQWVSCASTNFYMLGGSGICEVRCHAR